MVFHPSKGALVHVGKGQSKAVEDGAGEDGVSGDAVARFPESGTSIGWGGAMDVESSGDVPKRRSGWAGLSIEGGGQV